MEPGSLTNLIKYHRGTCMAQLLENLTPDFSLGHDLGGLGMSPCISSPLSRESAYRFSPSPSAPCLCAHALSFSKINKLKKEKRKNSEIYYDMDEPRKYYVN